MNIWEYYKLVLGEGCDDTTLTDLPADSPCGRDCMRVINAAEVFLHVCDPHPDIKNKVIEAVNEAVGIYWRG